MKNSDKNAILVSTVKSVKMQDAGEKRNYDKCCETPVCSTGSDNVYYPSFYLNTKQVPSLKGCEVEEEIVLVVKGKITSHSLNENDKNSNESYDISVKEIGILDDSSSEK